MLTKSQEDLEESNYNKLFILISKKSGFLQINGDVKTCCKNGITEWQIQPIFQSYSSIEGIKYDKLYYINPVLLAREGGGYLNVNVTRLREARLGRKNAILESHTYGYTDPNYWTLPKTLP